MASTFTDLLRLELQAAGENDDTWGDKANTVFSLIEKAIAGRVVIALTNINVTLTTNNGADDQARNMALALTGTLTGNVNIIVPNKSKLYIVTNDCTGGFSVTVKTAAGTGIVVEQGGQPTLLFCDATNVLLVKPSFVAVLNAAQQWTAAQASTPVALTSSSNLIAINASLSNKFRCALTENATLQNPTGLMTGEDWSILFVQDATGGRTLAYGAKYVGANGSLPSLTPTALRADLLTFSYDSTSDRIIVTAVPNIPL